MDLVFHQLTNSISASKLHSHKIQFSQLLVTAKTPKLLLVIQIMEVFHNLVLHNHKVMHQLQVHHSMFPHNKAMHQHHKMDTHQLQHNHYNQIAMLHLFKHHHKITHTHQ